MATAQQLYAMASAACARTAVQVHRIFRLCEQFRLEALAVSLQPSAKQKTPCYVPVEDDRRVANKTMSILFTVLTAAVLSAFLAADACQPENVDRCVKGVYDSSKGDPAFLPLSAEQLSHFCTRVVEARGCILRESEGCPDRARSFLEATMEGLKVAYEDLCKTHHLQKNAVYLRTAQCIRQNPATHCMYLYINQLDSIVGSNATAKMQMACCNMQFYSLCARASITKTCGEAAADQPDKVMVPKGTVLSRQLKIILEES
ncbi:hypothetical protein MRX96_017245 [Rhipicephalus microplus]